MQGMKSLAFIGFTIGGQIDQVKQLSVDVRCHSSVESVKQVVLKLLAHDSELVKITLCSSKEFTCTLVNLDEFVAELRACWLAEC